MALIRQTISLPAEYWRYITLTNWISISQYNSCRRLYATKSRCQWTHYTLQKRERKNRKRFLIYKWLNKFFFKKRYSLINKRLNSSNSILVFSCLTLQLLQKWNAKLQFQAVKNNRQPRLIYIWSNINCWKDYWFTTLINWNRNYSNSYLQIKISFLNIINSTIYSYPTFAKHFPSHGFYR